MTHKVKAGETMTSIARLHGVTLKALQAANPQIVDIHKLRVGQLINVLSALVPAPGRSPELPPIGPIPDGAELIDSPAFTSMDKRGKTKKINPLFRERLAILADLLALRGMQTLITDGLRTFAEQDELFKQGRTKPGPIVTNARGGLSNHNYGLAVDMYPVLNNRVFTDVPRGASVEFRRMFHAIQDAAGEESERLGLFWGARFSGITDTPHIQLLAENDMSPAECLRIFNANGRTLQPVWDEAERRVRPLV
jgi:hypothetical protein